VVPGPQRIALRTRLCLLVAIILTPALVLAGMLSLRSISTERVHIEEGLGQTLRQLSIEVDQKIQSTTALLVVLAQSHFLQIGDLEGFRQNASEISRQLGVQITVRRPESDQRIFSTGPQPDTPELALPRIRREAEQRAVQTGNVAISDVYFGPNSKRFLVATIMPVIRNGIAEYVLSIGIPSRTFSEMLQNAALGEDRIAAIVDSSNTIVARSEKTELYEGTKILPRFVDLTSARTEGIVEYTNREGIPLHVVFRRLQTTGWLIAVGVKVAVLDVSARNTIAYTAAAAALVFAFAVGLAYLLGGRLEHRFGTLGIDRRPTLEEFALFFDSAPNGVILVDDKGMVLLTNATLERMFGYTQKELIGQSVERLIPNDLRGRHARPQEDFARTPIARSGAERKVLGRRKDGREFPIEVGLHPIAIRTAHYTMATVVDVTERNIAEKALSSALTERDRLRRHLMRSSEAERLRLSHELHDQTGQTLTAATLAAKGIEKFLDPNGRQHLSKLNALLDQMGSTLHQVAWELRPASIDELGLAATLENYVSDWSDQTGVAAEFYGKRGDIDNVPDDVRTTIYRVVQEALTNIAKHASRASQVSVVINLAGAVIQLTIDDNGEGFELEEKMGAPGKYGALGIASMRERLSMIGGTLEIESSEGVGTTLFARIPIEPGEASL
jgi:two-component system, NarL family, sensor histidine kinase UhpB